MKKISVDTNFNYFGPDKPTLAPDEIAHFGLTPGERVVVYQDEEEWEGSLCHDGDAPAEYAWYVQLEGESVTVNPERFAGRAEGEANGRYFGATTATAAIAYRMLEDGLDPSRVSKYTKLPLEQLSRMLEFVNRKRSGQ